MSGLIKKMFSGFPFLIREISYVISEKTPFFIAKPRSIYIAFHDLTCDGLCIMCGAGVANAKGIRRENVSKEPVSGERFAEIIKQLKQLSGKGLMVSFTGGEPLLYKPLFEILDLCKREKVKFSFTTNGYLLNDKNIQRIIDSNLFNIGISIESLDPNVNEILRPVSNGTNKVLESIDKLIRAKEKANSDLSINLKCVLTQVNYHTIPDLIKKYGKTKGVFITLQPYTDDFDVPEVNEELWVKDIDNFRTMINELMLLIEQGYSINADVETLQGFINYFESGLNEVGEYNRNFNRQAIKDKTVFNKCTIGYSTIFITSNNGDIVYNLCPYLKPIGKFSDGMTLTELWYGKVAMKVREKTKKCVRFCNLSCTRKQSLLNKIILYLKIK